LFEKKRTMIKWLAAILLTAAPTIAAAQPMSSGSLPGAPPRTGNNYERRLSETRPLGDQNPLAPSPRTTEMQPLRLPYDIGPKKPGLRTP